MTNISTTRIKNRALLTIAVLFIALVFGVCFLLSGVSASARSASAARDFSSAVAYGYGGTGPTLDFSVNEDYDLVYDVPFSFGESSTTPDGDGVYRSGDVYSDKAIYVDSSSGDYRITDNSMKSTNLYVDMPIPKEGDLAAAIRDEMVTVRLKVLFVWGEHADQSSSTEAQADGTLTYYSGYQNPVYNGNNEITGYEPDILASNTKISFRRMNPGSEGSSNTYLSRELGNNSYNDDAQPFIRLKMAISTTVSNLSISIRSMAIRVELIPKNARSFEFTKAEIIDPDGLRTAQSVITQINSGETITEVKAGDIIVLTCVAKSGNDTWTLNESNAYGDYTSVPTGRFYRKLFLKGSTTEKIISFSSSSILTPISEYTDANGDPVTLTGYSGTKTAFVVGETNAVRTDLSADFTMNNAMKLKNQEIYNTSMTSRLVTVGFYLDTTPPEQPTLDASNVFYSKYIGRTGVAFFTDNVSYVTGKDENDNTVVTQVNLGDKRLAANPKFYDDNLKVEEGDANYYGSDLTIYYRATAWTSATKPYASDEVSAGFFPEDADGVYCEVKPSGYRTWNVTYRDLKLTMPTHSGAVTTYDKSAQFYIEFIAVDAVGNYEYCPKRYFINVDVTDYTFVYNKTLSTESGEGISINDNECVLSFTTLNEYGVPKSTTTTSPVFKRGEKVLVYVRFTNSAAYKKYILTAFTTLAGDFINTEKNSYDSSWTTAVKLSDESPYSFMVDSDFLTDESRRVMNFTFKQRATLSISGLTQTYTGDPIDVIAIPMSDGVKVKGNVIATYCDTENGTYTTNKFKDVGTYYVRLELKNSTAFYAYETAVLTITPATPRVTKLNVSPINYGESLAKVDYKKYLSPSVFNTAIQSYAQDGRYYSDRSYDGVYGYYKINENRLSTESNAYVKPNAGYMTVPVVFVPIKAEVNNLGEVTYARDVNGKFIEDPNYRQLDTISVDIYVRYSEEVAITMNDVGEDNTVTYQYDGTEKTLTYTITSALTDGNGNPTSEWGQNLFDYSDIVFATAPTDGSSPVTLYGAPVDAGRYTATVRLLEGAGCNYTGTFIYNLVIEKRKLFVEGYTGLTVFLYQQESPFSPVSYYGIGQSRIRYDGLHYTFSYYFYDGGNDFSTSVTEENSVPDNEFFVGTNMPQNAGRYVAKVDINENNFENADPKYIRFDIQQADASYVSMVMTAPTVGYNSAARNAHVDYRQKLGAILLTGNQNTGVKFEYHVFQRNVISYEARKLEGQFIVTYRAFRSEGFATETAEEFVVETQSYQGYDVGRQSAYIYFIPADSRNILPIGRQTEIVVGKANFNLSDVTVTPITYGYAVSSVSDLTISENVKISVGNGEYAVLDKDSPSEGYSYSLVGVDSARIYPAGDNYVVIKVTPNDPDRYNILNETLTLTVAKQTLEVGFASAETQNYEIVDDLRVYTYAYDSAVRPALNFAAVVGGDNLAYSDGEIAGHVTVYRYEAGQKVEPATDYTVASLPTGSYYATFTVDESNYVGEISFRYEITKDTLVVVNTPFVSGEERVVTYGTLMSTATFYSGKMAAATSGKTVTGTYSFRYPADTRFTDTGVPKEYNLTFTPDDLTNYEVCNADDLKIVLTVAKADLSAAMTVTVDNLSGGFEFVYGALSTTDDLAQYVDYTVPKYTDGSSYVDAPQEGYEKLSASITFAGLPNSGKLSVKDYPVTVTIEDDNYCGTYVDAVGLRVTRRPAKIVLYPDQNGETNEKIFRNRNQTVGCTLMAIDDFGEYTVLVTSESISQSFTLNGNALQSEPIDIGLYDAALTLRSENYAAAPLETTLTIGVDPSQIRISNLTQTYTIPHVVAVSLGLNEAIHTMTYVGKDSRVEYDALPSEAGLYEVHLHFAAESNNGYEGEVIYRENGEIAYLTINKCEARIVVNDVAVTYTGVSRDFRPTTEPYGLNLIVDYRAEDSAEDAWTSEEVLSANSSEDTYHYVRFTVDEKNYFGSVTIRYHISRAPLTVVNDPIFETFTYNGSVQPDYEAGRVDFNDRLNLPGTYSLDVSAISILPVGKHRVNYTFVAEDENFLPVTGRQCELTIVKRTLDSADFILGEISGNYAEYNGDSVSVDAKIADNVIYDPNGANADFRLILSYDNNVNAPRDPGAYTVRATVSSRNYQGEYLWDRELVIGKGTPAVSAPWVKATGVYNVGDQVTTADLESGTGSAKIKGKEVAVSGDFALVTTTLSKANNNDVEVVFTPNDTDRFNSVVTTVRFFAFGTNPLPGVTYGENWDDIDITVTGGTVRIEAVSSSTVYYGAKVKDFTLRFVGDEEAVSYLNTFGLLRFAEPESVPGAGTPEVAVVFTPRGENADTYTIMSGTVTVSIEKASWNEPRVQIMSYLDRPYSESSFLIDGQDATDIVALYGSTVYFFSDEERSVSIDDTVVTAGESVVYYRFVSDNYVDLIGSVTTKNVRELTIDNIEIGKFSKSYDGLPVSVADLHVRILNTEVAVSQEDMRLVLYDVPSDTTAVGRYEMCLYVENELVYGSRVFAFTINKRDVSNEMELDVYASPYGSVVAPRATLSGEYIDQSSYTVTVKYKKTTDGEASYNSNIPIRAGLYNVKVTVDGENYSGQRVFTYTVEKQAVRLVADSTYSYNYGAARDLTVNFRNVDNYDNVDLEYSVYYYSEVYSMSKTRPTNAGTYTARIVMEEKDYSINGSDYAEVTYVIRQMTSTITTAPTPINVGEGYHLVYGQAVQELSIAGGRATRNDVPIEGTFVVVDNGEKPNAGTYYATVKFLPTDKNYSEATAQIPVVIGQASATVTFEKLRAVYNGSSRRSALRYVVNPSNVAVSIVFVNSSNERLTNPVAAGTYELIVTSNDPNYRVTSTVDRFGNPAVFTIAKASVSNIVAPKTNPLSVGESVEKSDVVAGENYGLVYYEGFSNPIPGTFSFVETAYVFTRAGTYNIDYIFRPTDSNNYAEGRGITTITVNKAVATVTVTDCTFTYAEGFRMPTFTTYPAGLAVAHDVTFREYDPYDQNYVFDERDYVDVGTYEFHVWVVDENYTSVVTEFRIIINKKEIDMDFVDVDGNVVQQYVTTYGVFPTVDYILYTSGTANKRGYLLKDEERYGVGIADRYEINYRSSGSGVSYDDHRPPVNIGTYNLTISLINDNYTAEKTVLYKINKGVVTSVTFDKNSMENQVYGSVVAPIVLTEPAGVAYTIVYHGTSGGLLPTVAGSYNVTVQFNDESYETMSVAAKFRIGKKTLTVTGITVEDKTYDGTTSLAIKGDLYGVLPGDEISVTMTAETADGSSAPGSHYVKITSCKLSGLQAANYELVYPSYNLPITIYDNKVNANSGSSFITATGGFEAGTTVDFAVVDSKANASTFFENLTGRTTKVIGYTVKENGADVLVTDTFKVYVEIPKEFLDAEFEVKGVGALEGKNVVFTREGNYITFYASSSGQVQFKKTEFSYTALVILISIGIAAVALIALAVVTPTIRRRKISDDSAEKAYIKRTRRGY